MNTVSIHARLERLLHPGPTRWNSSGQGEFNFSFTPRVPHTRRDQYIIPSPDDLRETARRVRERGRHTFLERYRRGVRKEEIQIEMDLPAVEEVSIPPFLLKEKTKEGTGPLRSFLTIFK